MQLFAEEKYICKWAKKNSLMHLGVIYVNKKFEKVDMNQQ